MLKRVRRKRNPPTLLHVCMLSHSVIFNSPLSIEFSRQEYWSGLSFPSPGDHHNLGIESMSPALAGSFVTTEPPGKPPTLLVGM